MNIGSVPFQRVDSEVRDGRRFVLGAGQSYVVADRDGAHRSSSQDGARLLIVD